MSAYVSDGTLGVDLTRTDAGTTTDGENAIFTLGQQVTGSDGSVWQYVQAGEAISQYDCVAIDENFQMKKITTTLAAAGWNPGFAQVAFSDNDLGWVCVHGKNISVNVLASCAADVQLYTSGTGGKLDDTSTGNLVQGCVIITAATTTASTREVIATWPQGSPTP